MVGIPLGNSDYQRSVARETLVRLVNRYFETNPANQVEQAALISRPGLKYWKTVGTGPIRGVYSQPGSFNDALFVASGRGLYRIDADDTVTAISGTIFDSQTAFASMAATAAIGSTPEFLYVADGSTLWVYIANGYALGTLSTTGPVNNGDIVRVDNTYYLFTNGDVNAGTPAGTQALPWRIALGTAPVEALSNLRGAFDLDGVGGTTYSIGTTAHPSALARSSSTANLIIQARVPGIASNGILTTTVGANLSWAGPSLSGGGDDQLILVPLPDDLTAVAVAFVSSYIIVVTGQNNGTNGRFFWIEPGETAIRPLNFATAERSPDPLFDVKVIGDQFQLYGTSTTEIWYPTGDEATPFLRVQGQSFDRGVVEGTAVSVKDSVVVVDTDGVVYQLAGGQPKRVSDNSIEERIRRALREQKVLF